MLAPHGRRTDAVDAAGRLRHGTNTRVGRYAEHRDERQPNAVPNAMANSMSPVMTTGGTTHMPCFPVSPGPVAHVMY